MNKSIISFLAIILTSHFLWGTMDSQTTILDLKQKVRKFIEDRGWNKEPAHSAREISTSIICEAAELMEILNWHPASDIPVIVKQHIEIIKNEVADVAFALLDFCNELNIDLSEAVDEKLLLAAAKYPSSVMYKQTHINDNTTTVAILKSKMNHFAQARNWNQSLISIAMSIACEAAELLELFNWKTEKEIEQTIKDKIQDIKYEVADIAFALFSFCNELDIDLSTAMEEKIKINALKYPVKI